MTTPSASSSRYSDKSSNGSINEYNESNLTSSRRYNNHHHHNNHRESTSTYETDYYNSQQHQLPHALNSNLPSSGPTFDLGTFLRFAIKCTDCLEFIHRNNVIHGEVRLSAFQWSVEDTARVKMWNFGSGSKSLETYLTSEGWRKTANNKESMELLQNLLVYMSPEQTGRTTYVPDHRSDIYSLGIVFFVLLTGRNPFNGGPLDILNGILSRKVPLIHEIQLEVPEVVARIVEKMTNKVRVAKVLYHASFCQTHTNSLLKYSLLMIDIVVRMVFEQI